MQKTSWHNLLIAILFMTVCFGVKAQNEISSPYSGYGVGSLTHINAGPLDAMGGVAYAMQNHYWNNFKNPASYSAFDSLSLLVDASFSVLFGTLVTQETQKNTVARPNYLLLGLPITRHWRTSIGVLPFSNIGYAINDSKTIENIGQVDYLYQGEGGLYQLYWGHAFRIFKGFSLGFNLSYLFGSQNSTRVAEFAETNAYFLNSIVEDNNRINGLYISAGLQYFIKLKENHTLGLGAVYENSAYIATKRSLLARYYMGSYTGTMYPDTVNFDKAKSGTMRIPQSVGGGLSYNFKNKVIVGFDATWQNWTNYEINNEKDSTLRDALLFSAGLQFTPDPTSGKFGKRISFRIGAKYSTGYFSVKGTTISEYAVCAGIGLPIRTFNTNTSLNIMLEYGQMGTLKNNLIREDMFKITFNFILHERWYQRVKLD
jgi:hypothetical protein